jgi:hypothetical protein
MAELMVNDFKQFGLLAADHLVTVVLLGKHSEGRLNDATTQTEHQMQG